MSHRMKKRIAYSAIAIGVLTAIVVHVVGDFETAASADEEQFHLIPMQDRSAPDQKEKAMALLTVPFREVPDSKRSLLLCIRDSVTGEPIPDVSIVKSSSLLGVSDKDGLIGIPEGEGNLVIVHREHEPRCVNVRDLLKQRSTSAKMPITILLTPGVKITGTVVDSVTRLPVSGVHVLATYGGVGGHGEAVFAADIDVSSVWSVSKYTTYRRQAMTDSNGSFELAGLRKETHTIELRKWGYISSGDAREIRVCAPSDAEYAIHHVYVSVREFKGSDPRYGVQLLTDFSFDVRAPSQLEPVSLVVTNYIEAMFRSRFSQHFKTSVTFASFFILSKGQEDHSHGFECESDISIAGDVTKARFRWVPMDLFEPGDVTRVELPCPEGPPGTLRVKCELPVVVFPEGISSTNGFNPAEVAGDTSVFILPQGRHTISVDVDEFPELAKNCAKEVEVRAGEVTSTDLVGIKQEGCQLTVNVRDVAGRSTNQYVVVVEGESGFTMGIPAYTLRPEHGVKQWLDFGAYQLTVFDPSNTPVAKASVRLSKSHEKVELQIAKSPEGEK